MGYLYHSTKNVDNNNISISEIELLKYIQYAADQTGLVS